MNQTQLWWGTFKFDMTETKCWRVGQRTIAIERDMHEWSIWNKETPKEETKLITVTPKGIHETFKDSELKRYMTNQTSNVLVIEPSLADRSMTVRPAKPFVIMPEQEVQVYISTPLWMTVMLPETQIPIADMPFWRPSDSWFGPSTMHGDICYSKNTDAKTDRNKLETRSHRANSIITIKNAHDEPLTVERMSLPVPALKLYVDDSGMFWTDQVSILQEVEHNKPISHVRHSPPKVKSHIVRVSESRELSSKTSFLSTLISLID